MFKLLFKIISILLTLLLLVTAISFAYSSIKELTEKVNYESKPGELVTVSDHNMHVYIEGSGDDVYVFLSGIGTVSPMLDFKALYSELSDNATIAVVERYGYGYSDSYNSSRDIATVLSETREALTLSSLDIPDDGYILVPHGEAGLEAIYWAQQYPEEVKAIIGIDPLIPEIVTTGEIKSSRVTLLKFNKFLNDVGFTRFLGIDDDIDAFKSGVLTEAEKQTYLSLYYKKANNSLMIDEWNRLEQNANIVNKGGTVDTPIFFFISSGDYLSQINDNSMTLLIQYVGDNQRVYDANHYLHNYKYKEMTTIMLDFINNLD